jgi:hypothetical protein
MKLRPDETRICPYLLLMLLLFFLPGAIRAEGGVELSPKILDMKVAPREILEYKVTIKNNNPIKTEIYPVLTDISEKAGEKIYHGPGSADKASSVSSWASISRGVIALNSGESREVPLNYKINFSAMPGMYHGAIYFVSASNMYDAENWALGGVWPKINVNLEVGDQTVEKAQITRFSTDKNTYFAGPVAFTMNLSNSGNSSVVPGGTVRIYDRQGSEIRSMDFNSGKDPITQGETKEFKNYWDLGKEMGRFKAVAEIEYGEKEKKYFQDTIFFWVIPKRIIILFFLGTVSLLVLFLVLFFKSRKGYHMAAEEMAGYHGKEEVINLKD